MTTELPQTETAWIPEGPNLVVEGDNLDYIRTLPDASFRLIYIDPPLNTGRVQKRQGIKTTRAADGVGTRNGFKGFTGQSDGNFARASVERLLTSASCL